MTASDGVLDVDEFKATGPDTLQTEYDAQSAQAEIVRHLVLVWDQFKFLQPALKFFARKYRIEWQDEHAEVRRKIRTTEFFGNNFGPMLSVNRYM
jgi:hypothetical protein